MSYAMDLPALRAAMAAVDAELAPTRLENAQHPTQIVPKKSSNCASAVALHVINKVLPSTNVPYDTRNRSPRQAY
jgi:hypothetical protein